MVAPVEQYHPLIIDKDRLKDFVSALGVPRVEESVVDSLNSMILEVLNKQVASTMITQDNTKTYDLDGNAAQTAIDKIKEYHVLK
jgi:hypothetical protein